MLNSSCSRGCCKRGVLTPSLFSPTDREMLCMAQVWEIGKAPELILNNLKLELMFLSQERAWMAQGSWGAEPGPDKSPRGGGVAAATLLAVNVAPAEPTQGAAQTTFTLCYFFALRPTPLTYHAPSAGSKAATGGCINSACCHLTSYSGKALSLLTPATSCQDN